MKYAGLIRNDISAGSGVCVSFFVQGCPIKCAECHNPEAIDFNGGKEFTSDTMNELIKSIADNNIIRNFCVMGGEPLCKENIFLTTLVIQTIRQHYPDIKIYVWSGYEYEVLKKKNDSKFKQIEKNADILIAGPFDVKQKDLTLPMRGSRNQKVFDLKTGKEIECLNQVI